MSLACGKHISDLKIVDKLKQNPIICGSFKFQDLAY